MKVAILIEGVEHGGIQIIGFGIAKLLKSNGDIVFILHGENKIGEFLPEIKKVPLGKMIKYLWKIPYISPSFIIRFFRFLHGYKPDIVHSMGFPMGILASMLNYKLRGVCVVTTQTKIRRGNKILNQILINMFINKIILTSKYHKSIFPLKIKNDKIVIIPNMIDVNNYTNIKEIKDNIKRKLNIPLNKKVLLIACRLTGGKRVDIFLKIMKKLSLIDKNIIGIIAGDGYEKEKLRNITNQINIENSVKFVGSVKNINEYLYVSDLLIHTTEREIQPMILLEAGAFGVPVVCSNIGGNKTVIKNELNGIIVKNDDIEDYVNSILDLLHNTEKYDKMSKNSKRIISEKHDKSVIFQNIYTLYESLVK